MDVFIQSPMDSEQAAGLIGELLQDSGRVTATSCVGYETDRLTMEREVVEMLATHPLPGEEEGR